MKLKFITFNVTALANCVKNDDKFEILDFPDDIVSVGDPIVTTTEKGMIKVSFCCKVKEQTN